MDDREQRQRERAYQLWEAEGRQHGAPENHWQRAEDQHELPEQESEDVTEANQIADDPIAANKGKPSKSGVKR
jgi:hypothetical protein